MFVDQLWLRLREFKSKLGGCHGLGVVTPPFPSDAESGHESSRTGFRSIMNDPRCGVTTHSVWGHDPNIGNPSVAFLFLKNIDRFLDFKIKNGGSHCLGVVTPPFPSDAESGHESSRTGFRSIMNDPRCGVTTHSMWGHDPNIGNPSVAFLFKIILTDFLISKSKMGVPTAWGSRPQPKTNKARQNETKQKSGALQNESTAAAPPKVRRRVVYFRAQTRRLFFIHSRQFSLVSHWFSFFFLFFVFFSLVFFFNGRKTKAIDGPPSIWGRPCSRPCLFFYTGSFI